MNTGFFIVGIVLLLIGLGLYGYSTSRDGLYFAPPNGSSDRPYSTMGGILFVLGAIITVFSAVTPTTTRRVVTNEVVDPHPRKRVVIKEEKV